MQNLLVALIVIACTGYAVWVLIPGTLRRAAAQQALKWPWPNPIATRLQKAAKVSGGCGCDGCEAAQANRCGPTHPHPSPTEHLSQRPSGG